MSKLDIIRAWKDEEYCLSLSDTQRASLPQNPAGIIELKEEDMLQAEGGTTFSLTLGCDSLIFCPYTLGCPVTITIAQDQLLAQQ